MHLEHTHCWHVQVVDCSPRAVRMAFAAQGFTVDLPQTSTFLEPFHTRFTVAHTAAGAVTLWLLKHEQLARSVTITEA